MEEAYTIAQKRSSASAERNKHLYGKKAQCIDLQLNDRVLVRNLSKRGGPGKLRAFWEKEIYVVIRHIDPLSPVYEVKRETCKGPSRVLHRNLLMPCIDLPREDTVALPNCPKRYHESRNRRSRVSPRLQNRTVPMKKAILRPFSIQLHFSLEWKKLTSFPLTHAQYIENTAESEISCALEVLASFLRKFIWLNFSKHCFSLYGEIANDARAFENNYAIRANNRINYLFPNGNEWVFLLPIFAYAAVV